MKFAIEYKPREPRVPMFFSSAAKTLRECGWKGVWQLDQFPFREDSVEAGTKPSTIILIVKFMDRQSR
jgi:hypothetical protein